MTDDLQLFVSRHLDDVEDLEGVVVSDRDGVTIVEARADVTSPSSPRPNFLGVFSIASEQASKLGLGKNSAIVSYFSNHQVVQFNYSTLVLTFVAKSTANTGLIYSMEKEMRDTLTDLLSAVNVP